MVARSYNLDEIFAVTTKYIDDNVQRVWEVTTPLHKQIMKKKKYVDGGNRLTVALDFNPNNTIGFITGTSADLLNINTQQNLIPAELDWKYLNSNFSVTLQDLNTTADSKHAIVSLVTMLQFVNLPLKHFTALQQMTLSLSTALVIFSLLPVHLMQACLILI